MKKSYIISGVVALTILATATVAIPIVLATDSSDSKGFFGRSRGHFSQGLTEEQKIEMQTKMDAVKAALEAGDYNAWVAAEKSINENSPVLEKINADNFASYVNAWSLRQQAGDIMEGLGLGKGGDMGRRGHASMVGGFGFGKIGR